MKGYILSIALKSECIWKLGQLQWRDIKLRSISRTFALRGSHSLISKLLYSEVYFDFQISCIALEKMVSTWKALRK